MQIQTNILLGALLNKSFRPEIYTQNQAIGGRREANSKGVIACLEKLPGQLESNVPEFLHTSIDTEKTAKLIGQTFVNSMIMQLSRVDKIDQLEYPQFMNMVAMTMKQIKQWLADSWNTVARDWNGSRSSGEADIFQVS